MRPSVKLLIPTLLCTAWCGTCVWYARTYLGAGREVVPIARGEQTYRMLNFNATTLRPTDNERLAMIEGMKTLTTWKFMVEPLGEMRDPFIASTVDFCLEVRQGNKPPTVLLRSRYHDENTATPNGPFPLVVGMLPVGGSVSTAQKLTLRIAQQGGASTNTVANPFRIEEKQLSQVVQGTLSSVEPGAFDSASVQSVPLYQSGEGGKTASRKVLFLTIRRLYHPTN